MTAAGWKGLGRGWDDAVPVAIANKALKHGLAVEPSSAKARELRATRGPIGLDMDSPDLDLADDKLAAALQPRERTYNVYKGHMEYRSITTPSPFEIEQKFAEAPWIDTPARK